jgi:two-component system, response regulator YesN
MLNKVKILVVDDQPAALEELEIKLTQSGADVATSTSVDQALKIAKSWRPAVLLAGLTMPYKDGLILLKALKKIHQPSLAIALSNYNDAEKCRQALDLGFSEFLLKPVEPDQIVKIIANNLENNSFR